ncbi:hypothetical protein [Tessaracoccus sp.]
MTRRAHVLLLFALVLFTASCSAPAAVAPSTVTLSITSVPPTEPVVEEVPLGSVVTLVVSSEVDGLLHVHGYDHEIALVAGETVQKSFTATISGGFELETHDPDAVWAKLVVS